MAKVKGPLLSMRASGSIAGTNVYASWRGVPYARIHVVPANPRTVAQTLTRDVFAWINSFFRALGPIGISPWRDATVGRPLTDRNACIKSNLTNLRTNQTLVNLVGSPGSHGGPAMSAFGAITNITPGAITVNWAHGTLPAGWTLAFFQAFALVGQMPIAEFDARYKEIQSAVGPIEDDIITGLTPGVAYRVVGWAKYLRPDGSFAFSPSSVVLATSGA